MSPAPLRPALLLALLLVLALLLAAAASPQQLPTRGRPETISKANAPGGGGALSRRPRQEVGGGFDSARVLGLLARPVLRVLGTQLWANTGSLQELASLAGAGSVAPLSQAGLGASSGSVPDPAAFGTPPGEDEVADLVV